ncbi:hypothetical protein [Methylobacterium sp. Leaf106]|uniref:hypothetical protein n=1 Tax=Methylobacterium sp. Leaf106 TaxID=1736255 RepID=UPI0006F8624F|nr:hypothetical protein [Methylobacterium sp. Leaf106]KQP48807.1 hypothetical protein ASF34_20805 [Methylobacterium sp. Leaf106]
MKFKTYHSPASAQPEAQSLTLDPRTRLRLGRQLQSMYKPIIDEPLDPRLAELMQQLAADRHT